MVTRKAIRPMAQEEQGWQLRADAESLRLMPEFKSDNLSVVYQSGPHFSALEHHSVGLKRKVDEESKKIEDEKRIIQAAQAAQARLQVATANKKAIEKRRDDARAIEQERDAVYISKHLADGALNDMKRKGCDADMVAGMERAAAETYNSKRQKIEARQEQFDAVDAA